MVHNLNNPYLLSKSLSYVKYDISFTGLLASVPEMGVNLIPLLPHRPSAFLPKATTKPKRNQPLGLSHHQSELRIQNQLPVLPRSAIIYCRNCVTPRPNHSPRLWSSILNQRAH